MIHPAWHFTMCTLKMKVKVAQFSDSLRPHRLYSPRNSPGQNNGGGILSLLQGINPTQESNRISCIADGFFTNWATREAWTKITEVRLSPVAQSCLTLSDPIDCSTPGFPVHHQVLELAQIHVHRVGDAIQQSHPSVGPFSFCLQSFLASGSFPMSQLFPLGGQSIGASASASVLPMNIRGWFSLGLTGLISLLSKGLSRVFSSTTVLKYQFFST